MVNDLGSRFMVNGLGSRFWDLATHGASKEADSSIYALWFMVYGLWFMV